MSAVYFFYLLYSPNKRKLYKQIGTHHHRTYLFMVFFFFCYCFYRQDIIAEKLIIYDTKELKE